MLSSFLAMTPPYVTFCSFCTQISMSIKEITCTRTQKRVEAYSYHRIRSIQRVLFKPCTRLFVFYLRHDLLSSPTIYRLNSKTDWTIYPWYVHWTNWWNILNSKPGNERITTLFHKNLFATKPRHRHRIGVVKTQFQSPRQIPR